RRNAAFSSAAPAWAPGSPRARSSASGRRSVTTSTPRTRASSTTTSTSSASARRSSGRASPRISCRRFSRPGSTEKSVTPPDWRRSDAWKKGCGMAESRLHKLSARGQSVWIDYLSRDLLARGELKRMMEEDAVVGVTSNPTIFQKAISQGNAYDEQLKELVEREDDPKEIFLQLAVRDVENALTLLAPVHERNAQD